LVRTGRNNARLRADLAGVPGIYLQLLVDVVRDAGCDEARLLDGLDVDSGRLLRPDYRVSLEVCHRALSRAMKVMSHLGLGYRYGRALRVTLHGSLGMLALSSMTAGDALQATVRYVALRAPFLGISFRQEEQVGIVELLILRDVGSMRHFFEEALMLSIAYANQQVFHAPADQLELWMTGEAPAYFNQLDFELPTNVRYGMPACQLRIPVAFLTARPMLADPNAEALARQLCEQEFQVLFAQEHTLQSRIIQQLKQSPEQLPTLEEMASRFFMSSRTLKRRLQEESLNYRDLIEQELKQRAVERMKNPALSVSEIAFQLGYHDVSNFSRAFRRWTGKTPSEYRRRGG